MDLPKGQMIGTSSWGWHNVRIVGVPKCRGSWSIVTVYTLLERVLILDEVPLLDRSHTASQPAARQENPLSTTGTGLHVVLAPSSTSLDIKQSIKRNSVSVYPE
ncbi:unnamed protein product [Pleuronectes platessa]|uniref:Uncharacterized protein n=1 Tax=Pleuronectes platessa TaxID=8262 RepID=A0A9N7Z9B7_PLEPL|nr:unnamed protein product [Pleuronectes platessa]